MIPHLGSSKMAHNSKYIASSDGVSANRKRIFVLTNENFDSWRISTWKKLIGWVGPVNNLPKLC
jgi:hypothetical protein